ncbi:MAG: hypothetical protein K2K12_00110, partial [Clostridia bacterium]|nr:hypothetical protein [Clostridia bacterium]
MKKKLLSIFVAVLLCLSTLGLFMGCGDGNSSGNGGNGGNGGNTEPKLKEITGVTFEDKTVSYNGEEQSITVSGTVPEGVSVSYTGNKGTNPGVYNATASLSGEGYKSKTLTAKLTIEALPPTAAEIVRARKNAVDATAQGYDFNLTFTGDFHVMGLGTALQGKYDGQYRYNKNTDNLTFMRTTSGALLYDSTAYLFTSGDSQIKLTMDGKTNTVKKVSVETPEDQDVTMVNLPVVAIVDAVKEANISNITVLKNAGYSYSCEVDLDASTMKGLVLSKILEKIGTGISFKGINFAAQKSKLYFNITNDQINDFRLNFAMGVQVGATKVIVDFDYVQKGSSVAISLPSTKDFSYTTSDIQTDVNAINTAIADLKDDAAYSLDLTAVNEFDPGWNKLATKDSYTARMYKKTEDGTAWFNHSFMYKAHSEEDGKETYKYTLGNVNGTDADNQGTWLISRKGSNTQSKAEGTADTQFDFLTSIVKLSANEIDCIKTQTKGTETIYTVHLGRTGTQSVQQKIIDMINTN